MNQRRYKRILLKLSGEALGAAGSIQPARLRLIVNELKQLNRLNIEVAVVVGAGNLWRKRTHGQGISGQTADYIGLVATVMNGLALREALRRNKVPVVLQSPVAYDLPTVNRLDLVAARGALRRGQVVIFSGGTGQPFFTTDTAAALRAAQVKAELIIKAGPADGVYSADPRKDSQAVKYQELTLAQAQSRRLAVMDRRAFVLCLKNQIPIIVCRWQKGVLLRVISGQAVGTLIRP